MNFFDTIAAIATPLGSGGIAVIRISGEGAVSLAKKLIFPCNNKDFTSLESHKMTISEIKTANGNLIDEALCVIMRAPRSYTGEDVVEIHCHGGVMSARLIMDELQNIGIRQGERGEFTRRAFINGKTDLSQAEAVMDIIDAKSRFGVYDAATGLKGKLGEKINSLRQEVLSLAARLSAAADFPDEIDEIDDTEFKERTEKIKGETDKLIQSFEKGRLIRDGISTVIAGKPNVGKSSLLNALAGEDRAIVTDIPGTTRDTVEEYINIGNLALHLKDTAGIRESSDVVEKIGIERAKNSIAESDFVLFVLDSSQELSDEDLEIAQSLKDKNVIVILNKQDKKVLVSSQEIAEKTGFSEEDILPLSLLDKENYIGLDALEKRICNKFMIAENGDDEIRISNRRHRDCLIKAKQAMESLQIGLDSNIPKDLLYIDLEEAASGLGEITGETVQEEIVNQVFEKFCVGK